jgi:hypothetical protein
MFRTLVIVTVVVSLSGCEAMAEAARQQEEQREAYKQATQRRYDALTPEEQDRVMRCQSAAEGKINALRMAGQGGAYYNANRSTIGNACMDNPYFAETIPTAPTQVIINTPPPRSDGGLSLYQQCLAAQAAGAGACP